MLKLLTVSALLVATLFLGVVFTARAQVAPNQNQILLPGYWGGGFLISTSSAASTKLGTSLVDLAGSWVSGILPISRGGTGTSTPPADGQLLIGNAGGTWDYIASSTLAVLTNYWTKSGTNLYYTAGNVGIGTSAPTHALTFPQSSTGIALYNTADQTTNYERVRQYWDSNSYKISVEAGGTGSSNRQLEISGGGGAARLSQSGQVSGSFSLSRSTSGSGFSAGQGLFNLFGTHTQTAGTMVGQLIGYTISQSGTAGYTALLINPTESSIGSGNRRLIDAQVGGTSRFVVESGGNVGIGTTTPGSMLDVNGDISFATGKNIGRTDLNITTDTTQSFFYGIKRANADARFNGMKVYNNANGAGGLPASRIGFYTDKTGLSASTERMTITEDGNVGIGTTSPSAKLEIGDSLNGQIMQVITNSNTGTGAVAELQLRNGYTANSDSLRLFTTGANYVSSGAVQQDAGVIGSDSNLGGGLSIYARAAAPIRFYTSGIADANERLRITSAGNVGIGTTSPSSILHIENASPLVTYYDTAGVSGVRFNSIANTGSGPAYRFISNTSNILMTMLANGNVGIGTTSPGVLLEAYGSDSSTVVTSGSLGAGITNSNTTDGNMSKIFFSTIDTAGSRSGSSQIAGIHTSHTSGAVSGDLAFLTRNAGTLSEKMRVLANGNVGIGTTTPSSILSINNVANFTTATSTFYSSGGINLTGGGCFAINGTCISGGGSSYTFTYPLVNTAGTVSLAFGTTTSNTWAGTQTFTNASSTAWSSNYASSTSAFFGNLNVVGTATSTFAGGVQAVTGFFSGLVQFTGNILLAASSYINFGSLTGSGGYGFRDNAGIMEFKNSGGAWTAIPGSIDTYAASTTSGDLYRNSIAVTQNDVLLIWGQFDRASGCTPSQPLAGSIILKQSTMAASTTLSDSSETSDGVGGLSSRCSLTPLATFTATTTENVNVQFDENNASYTSYIIQHLQK